MAKFWYTFSTTGNADPLDPANYSNPVNNAPACPGNAKICAIYADDSGFSTPIINNQLQDDIVRALQLSADQSTVVLRT